MQWGPDGELIYLLGATKAEFGGSAVATLQGLLTGMPPEVDPAAEKVLAEILVAGSRDGMLTAAHDVADGGVGLALAEMAMRAGTGAQTWCPTASTRSRSCSQNQLPAPWSWCRGPRNCGSPRCAGPGVSV